jgi:hypothetical protein
MDAPSWARIEAVFDRAHEMEGAARAAYLASACAGDPDLRREVDGLLRAAELSDDFLEVPVGQAFLPEKGSASGPSASSSPSAMAVWAASSGPSVRTVSSPSRSP